MRAWASATPWPVSNAVYFIKQVARATWIRISGVDYAKCSRYTYHLGESKAGLNTKCWSTCNTFSKENKFSMRLVKTELIAMCLVSWNSTDARTTSDYHRIIPNQLMYGWPWRPWRSWRPWQMLRPHEGDATRRFQWRIHNKRAGQKGQHHFSVSMR